MRLPWVWWRWSIRWLARSQGFLDPLPVLAQLRQFGQPAEILAPTELLRAGAVLHARGLMNSQAIQHNLDWIWPYWVVRQFNPHDIAFVPRAFSLTHINLTHRNWTAVGLPDLPALPIVDPRGLVTPWLDGWSLDGWIVTAEGEALVPSGAFAVEQRLHYDTDLAVVTEAAWAQMRLVVATDVVPDDGMPACRMRLTGSAATPGWLVVALRPYNPEGISAIDDIAVAEDRRGWLVNKRQQVQFSLPPDKLLMSHYRRGDVYHGLQTLEETSHVRCPVGMATAAALFALTPGTPREVTVRVPIAAPTTLRPATATVRGPMTWPAALEGHCAVQMPDPRWQFLYDAALRMLVLHAPGEVYPGPYTYKRFWFRDATFMLHALLCAGLTDRAERALDQFPARQTATGHFCSQDGEWDSNGQALWIFAQFCRMTGRAPKLAWRQAIYRGARWIRRKRLSDQLTEPHAGLLPAGFSAEHLGPNDYYYWDDFWSVAGLRAAADLAERFGDPAPAAEFRGEAERLLSAILRSLERAPHRTGHAIPASPHRRMDAGAIGSLVADYPLRLWEPNDSRVRATAEFLLQHCFVHGGFFQTISHSGINPYLTLHVAQVLLRAGDPRYLELMQSIAHLATSTGQWPEAIHPATLGGCMGDGQHVWAVAEWLLMVRHCFVREEGSNRLILGSGMPRAWMDQTAPITCGPAPTAFGPITLSILPRPADVTVSWSAAWHAQTPLLDIELPGCKPARPQPEQTSIIVPRPGAS